VGGRSKQSFTAAAFWAPIGNLTCDEVHMREENVAIRESAAGRSIVRNFRIICWKPGAPPQGELQGLAWTARRL
jgi:hypothetical protein